MLSDVELHTQSDSTFGDNVRNRKTDLLDRIPCFFITLDLEILTEKTRESGWEGR